MQNINKWAKDFVRNHKMKKNYILIAAFMSVLVAFAVTASLILPAISASSGDISPFSVASESSVALGAEDILDVSFDVAEGGTIDSKQVNFTLKYAVAAGQLNSERKIITYQLPDQIVIPDMITGEGNRIVDGSLTAGYFTISETGLITITCTDEYIQAKQEELDTTGARGTLTFEATVERSADNNNDVTINFGTEENPKEITIPFEVKRLDVDKTGTPDGNGNINWEIIVENPQEHDLGDYVLSDEMFKGMTAVEMLPENAGAFDSENGTITFNQGVTNKKITIKYSSTVSKDSITDAINNAYGNITNNVSLSPDAVNDEEDIPVNDKADVSVSNAFSISKSGKGDYSDVSTPSVDWTITIGNSMGVNLNGMIIRDEMFKYIPESDITLPDGVTFTLDSTNGYLTITSDTNLTSLDIKYSSSLNSDGTPVEVGDNVSNSAQIIDDKNTPDTSDDTPFKDTWDKEVKYNPYYFDKSSSVDSANQTITWTIKFSKNDANSQSLAGFKITDEMFANALNGSIKVTTDYWPNDAVDYSISGNVITIGETDENAVVVTFKTSATDFADENGITTNTATLKDKDSDEVIYTDTDSAVYNPRNEISKKKDGFTADPLNENKLTITYTIRVVQDNGITGQIISDRLTSNDGNAEFYITKSQAQNFKLTYATTDNIWGTTPLDSSYYTVKFYDADDNLIDFETDADAKATRFEVVISDTINDKTVNGYKYYAINVSYSAIADASNITPGSTVTFSNKAQSNVVADFVSQDHTHKKIDYSDPPFKKFNSKNDGTSNRTKLSVDSLEIVEIDGVRYYKLDWYINTNTNGNYDDVSSITLVDTLPAGFMQYGDVTCYSTVYSDITSSFSWKLNKDYTTHYEYYTVTQNGENQELTMKFPSSAKCVTYSAVISVETLQELLKNNSGSYVFENSVVDAEGKYQPVKHTQEIKQGVLNKENLHAENPYKRYQIVVNPNASNLSSGDEITLTDTFITTDFNDNGTMIYCYDKGAVNVNLNELLVYEVDESGNRTLLDRSQYSYLFDNQPELKTAVENLGDFTDVGSRVWNGPNVTIPAGAVVTVKIEGYYDAESWAGPNDRKFDFCCNGYTAIASGVLLNVDDSGNATATFTATNRYSGPMSLSFWTGNANKVSVSYSIDSHDYAAKLELTLPDEKSLVVEYTYYCTKREGTADKVGIMNSVTTNTQLGAEVSEDGDVLVLTGDSSGTLETDKYLKFEKVDVGSFADNLVAEFELYKYDSENNVWLPAIDFTSYVDKFAQTITWGGSGSATPKKFMTASTGNKQFAVYLENGVLYKLVEVNPPDGYVVLSNDIYFAYGEKPNSADLPEGIALSDVELTLPEGSMYIKNHTTTKLVVNKQWLDDVADHSADSVTVQLYSSPNKVSNGFPTNLTEVGTAVILNQANSWTYEWTDLPTGNADGQAIYYYVKEINYTVGGITTDVSDNSSYVPYYVGNAVNKYNGTPVKIVNTNGLAVEKLWVDADNKTMTPPVNQIAFQIYRSVVSPTDPDRVNGPNGLPTDAVLVDIDSQTEFILSSENNWKILVKNLPYQDSEGNMYYYYVLETSRNEGFNVSYNGNGNSNSGVIQIKNKSETRVDPGVTLPETGGKGTTTFYVMGFAIVAFAVITKLYIDKKRNEKEKRL